MAAVNPARAIDLVSALWVLDFMWTMASGGAAGVNMQTGINHLDFVSYYSAIRNDAKGAVSIGPEYYGMLAFAQAGKGERIALDYDADGMNLTAYAVLGDHGHLMLTLINKDRNADTDITVTTGQIFQKATALRLKGHALDSADNVTLGGSEVAADGRWQPTWRPAIIPSTPRPSRRRSSTGRTAPQGRAGAAVRASRIRRGPVLGCVVLPLLLLGACDRANMVAQDKSQTWDENAFFPDRSTMRQPVPARWRATPRQAVPHSPR